MMKELALLACWLCAAALLPCSDAHAQEFSASPSASPPSRMDGIGNSAMTITTQSVQAQTWFDQGLNLLHCYWDFEAYRAFKEAIRNDPSAAMAYWGLYMSLNYNQAEMAAERRGALRRAQEASPTASDREQRYIRALVRLNEAPGPAGQSAYIEEMQSLVETYPDDLQAKLFLVKFLLTETGGYFIDREAEAGGRRRSAIERARDILRPLLRSHPDNLGVHHYWIHAYEYAADPTPAVPSAELLPTLAPNAGHILHMPGHVYFQLGAYDKAYVAFQTSLRFDERYMRTSGVGPVDNWNYVHNLDYLVANCAEDGRYGEGERWGKVLQELPVLPTRQRASASGLILYGGRTALARLYMRYGNWSAAAASLDAVRAGTRQSPRAGDYMDGLALYVHGMAAVQRGDVTAGSQNLEKLAALGAALRNRPADTGADWYFDAARRILAVSTFELAGSLLSLQGQHDAAIDQLQRAVEAEAQLGYWEPPHYPRPVLESLAEAYLRARRFDDARQAYRSELEARPRSAHAWFGIARTWLMAGDAGQTRQALERFLELWPDADRDLPQVEQATAWLLANP